jgi:hypothetical protein
MYYLFPTTKKTNRKSLFTPSRKKEAESRCGGAGRGMAKSLKAEQDPHSRKSQRQTT